jgi:hypothetical protein
MYCHHDTPNCFANGSITYDTGIGKKYCQENAYYADLCYLDVHRRASKCYDKIPYNILLENNG